MFQWVMLSWLSPWKPIRWRRRPPRLRNRSSNPLRVQEHARRSCDAATVPGAQAPALQTPVLPPPNLQAQPVPPAGVAPPAIAPAAPFPAPGAAAPVPFLGVLRCSTGIGRLCRVRRVPLRFRRRRSTLPPAGEPAAVPDVRNVRKLGTNRPLARSARLRQAAPMAPTARCRLRLRHLRHVQHAVDVWNLRQADDSRHLRHWLDDGNVRDARNLGLLLLPRTRATHRPRHGYWPGLRNGCCPAAALAADRRQRPAAVR